MKSKAIAARVYAVMLESSPDLREGRAILGLAQGSLSLEAEIDIILPKGVILEAEYRNSGIGRSFAGGKVAGSFCGRLMVDFSYRKNRGDALSLCLSGTAADTVSTYECKNLGKIANQVERELSSLHLPSSSQDLPFLRAENPVDGNPWAFWELDESAHMGGEKRKTTMSTTRPLKKCGHELNGITGIHPELAAEELFGLGGE